MTSTGSSVVQYGLQKRSNNRRISFSLSSCLNFVSFVKVHESEGYLVVKTIRFGKHQSVAAAHIRADVV